MMRETLCSFILSVLLSTPGHRNLWQAQKTESSGTWSFESAGLSSQGCQQRARTLSKACPWGEMSMRWNFCFPAEWRKSSTILRHPRATLSACRAVMASPFSGALQLTDLDDFIGPSQVGRPRACRAGGGSGPGRAAAGNRSYVCLFLRTRPVTRSRAQGLSLVPYLLNTDS